MPLKAPDGKVLAVLVVANSRRGLVELQQHIRAIGYGVAGIGILLAIAASLWITSRHLATHRATGGGAPARWLRATGTRRSKSPRTTKSASWHESFNHMTQPAVRTARAAGAERTRRSLA